LRGGDFSVNCLVLDGVYSRDGLAAFFNTGVTGPIAFDGGYNPGLFNIGTAISGLFDLGTLF
jgi:hypothetical protein